MRKVLISLLLVFSLVRPAAAQWAVIDVTNLQQNVMNTISTFTQEYQQVQQYVTQLQQLQYEYMQLKGIANGDVSPMLGIVTEALNLNRNYQSSLSSLYVDLNSAKCVLDVLFGRMSASGLSDADWMTREVERNKALQNGNGFLNDYETGVLNQVGKRYEQVQSMQEKITSTGGTHEAMQLMNSQMNALLGTTNQLLESNALAAKRAIEKDTEDTGRAKATVDNYQNWLESYRTTDSAVRNKLQSIKTQ